MKVYLPKNYGIDKLGFTSILLEVNPSIHNQLILKLKENGIETIPTFFYDIFSLSYFKNQIKNELTESQKKIYFENFEKNSNYQYPNKLITISRRWVTSYLMRSIFLDALSKSCRYI